MYAWSEESNYGHEKASTVSWKLLLCSGTSISTAQVPPYLSSQFSWTFFLPFCLASLRNSLIVFFAAALRNRDVEHFRAIATGQITQE